ncbi:Putative 115 kDa protein in type-1 retrotransposable element R1DM [Eumeta japonica]|uniref:115 kDa protein in type-1 retrotransposable element R1DM n=1 Tax=Eumeta variegata TaxID=151549 RepID=A0A4C1SE36_EUMVA|nr:Putative 115 kDa protein in type-1 retrotransposable element R1DM [Eumeta japonica]
MANKCLELGYFPEPGRWRQSRGRLRQRVVAGVETQLRALGCPVNLHGLVRGYLRDREVVVKYAGGECRKGTSKGCIQVGFVDRGGGQPRLARVHCWGVRNKLRFAPSKTNSMVLTKKLKYDDPVVHMNGERISSVGEIRLLGLTIDKKLTFIPHVAKACKKATNIYKGLARAAKATWGLSPEIVRTIYITVIEPIVLYASCAWAPATRKLGVRKMLDAVQRSVALKACRAHRTVSCIPRSSSRGCSPDIRLERPVYFGDLPHPAHVPEIGYESVEDLDPQTVDRLAVVGPRIFTDGSRIEGKVGAALTEWRDGRETWYSTLRLDPFCTVFQAEMVALQRAIRRVKNGKDGLVNIFSDSRSSLEVLAGPKTITLWPMKLARHLRSCATFGRLRRERAAARARPESGRRRRRQRVAAHRRRQRLSPGTAGKMRP